MLALSVVLFVLDLGLAYVNRKNSFIMGLWLLASACWFFSIIMHLK